jgi:AcrR family transcriptional regulator
MPFPWTIDMEARRPSSDSSPWMPFESRRRARDEKREAVLRTALQCFLEHGYHRATLNDVAERLNVTKPALYNYFRGKDDILFECWTLGHERVDEFIAGIEASGGDGLARLRKLVHAYARIMATDFGASLVRFDSRDLSEKNRKVTRSRKKSVDRTFRRYITEGISDGSIKPCNAKLSAFAIAGSLNWIGHWYQRDGTLSADAIADEFSIRLTEGLATTGQLASRAQSAPAKKQRSGGRSK